MTGNVAPRGAGQGTTGKAHGKNPFVEQAKMWVGILEKNGGLEHLRLWRPPEKDLGPADILIA
jgi:hypothetical protein